MKKFTISLLILLVLLSGCATAAPEEREIFAMDTLMQITLWGDEDAAKTVTAEINRLDGALSVTAEDSTLSRLNRGGTAQLPEELLSVLTQAVSYTAETDGAFDITVRPLMLAWGFTQERQQVPDEQSLLELLPRVGAEHIHISGSTVQLDNGTQLDLGGIAKGYTAERCKALLAQRGVTAALLNLGGNVQTLGSKPDGSAWLVGIADPKNPSQAIASLTFYGSKALVTSGSYQRYFEQDGVRYGHILDPNTGKPVQNGLASVTVIADSATAADVYSTALFVMGYDNSVTFWRKKTDFEAIFLFEDGTLYATQGAAPLLGACDFTVVER